MKRAALIIAACLLIGCATVKTLQPVGGSRADATVLMAYEYGAFEKPQPRLDDALATARARCLAWGYSDAQPFGTGFKRCETSNEYGCLSWLVTITYQCQGSPAPAP